MRAMRVLCLFLIISFVLSSQWCEISYANESLPTGRESLIDKYHKIEKYLEKSAFGIPFYLESSVSKNASHVEILSIVVGESFGRILPVPPLRSLCGLVC